MFPLKRIFGQMQISLYRMYATTSQLIEVSHEDSTGITTISMARPPVNSLNTELLNTLNTCVTTVQESGSRGIILTSSLPTVFSAGLDIMEMYKRSEEQMTNFWHTLQDTWSTLYGLGIPLAAAINGSSPAGGCLLALTCEYRVFTEGKHTIGLNETQLGLLAPPWFRNLLIDTIGYRKAELALLRGSLFSPKEALEIGLVDEVVADKSEAIKKCQDYINGFKNIPSQARNATKLDLRKQNLAWLKENRDADTINFIKFAQVPKVQAGLRSYIAALKNK